MKRLTPEKVFASERRVEEAVESVLVMVTGEEPTMVKLEQEVEPEQEAVVVAVVVTRPPEPTYARPCESEESRSAEDIVEEAVERKPLEKPMVVVVETPQA